MSSIVHSALCTGPLPLGIGILKANGCMISGLPENLQLSGDTRGAEEESEAQELIFSGLEVNGS
jgi:hypothetical protein